MKAGTLHTATLRWRRYVQLTGFYWLMGLLCTLITYGSTFGLLRLLLPPTVGANLGGILMLFWTAPIGSMIGWVSSRRLTNAVRGLSRPWRGVAVLASLLAGVLVLPIYVLSGIIENYLVGATVDQTLGFALFACVNATLVGFIMVMGDKGKARSLDESSQ